MKETLLQVKLHNLNFQKIIAISIGTDEVSTMHIQLKTDIATHL